MRGDDQRTATFPSHHMHRLKPPLHAPPPTTDTHTTPTTTARTTQPPSHACPQPPTHTPPQPPPHARPNTTTACTALNTSAWESCAHLNAGVAATERDLVVRRKAHRADVGSVPALVQALHLHNRGALSWRALGVGAHARSCGTCSCHTCSDVFASIASAVASQGMHSLSTPG
eukprot:360328-Chlamydomonas_euryale.AAC.23